VTKISMGNKLDLKHKWVIVTGASSGLGRQLCIEKADLRA